MTSIPPAGELCAAANRLCVRGFSAKLFAVVASVAALAISAVYPLPAAGSSTPALAGKTTIVGEHPGSMRVSLSSSVTVDTAIDRSTRDVAISGRGRFVGAALVPEGTNEESPTLLLGRIPYGDGTRTFAVPVDPDAIFESTNFNGFLATYPSTTTLSGGTYRLYFLPDKGRARVVLRLRGLAGTTALAPSVTADYIVETPSRVSPAGQDSYYAAGTEHRVGASGGLLFQAISIQAQAHAAGVFNFCSPENSELPALLQYAPGCPGGSRGIATDRGPSISEKRLLYFQAMAPTDKARHGQGFVFAAASVLDKLDHVAVWLRFR